MGESFKDVRAATAAAEPTAENIEALANSLVRYSTLMKAFDAAGKYLYVVDYLGRGIRIIDVDTAEVTTVAGDGTWSSTDGVGTEATFNSLRGLAIDNTNGYLDAADTNNHRIRHIKL